MRGEQFRRKRCLRFSEEECDGPLEWRGKCCANLNVSIKGS